MRDENKEAHQEEEDTLIEVSLEEKDGSQIGKEVTAEEGTILDQETEEAQVEIKEDQDLTVETTEMKNHYHAESVTEIILAKIADVTQDIKRRSALVLDVPTSTYTMMFARNPSPMI